MTIYHVTTNKKAKRYKETGYIKAPVRGFDTLTAAMAWAIKTGRTVIYEMQFNKFHKLPDHSNQFGHAYWNEENITNINAYSVQTKHRRNRRTKCLSGLNSQIGKQYFRYSNWKELEQR